MTEHDAAGTISGVDTREYSIEASCESNERVDSERVKPREGSEVADWRRE